MSDGRPEVSVVTINYNQGRFLPEALASVARQSPIRWQHIIVDPGSTDDSHLVYEKLFGDPRYTIISEPDKGPADGLNKGFSRAEGHILYYLNADDRVLPGAFETALRILRPVTEPACICGAGYVIDESGAPVRPIFSHWKSVRDYAFGASVAVQQATFFSRSAFDASGGFNPANRICWDGELLVDMELAGVPIITSREPLGEFRIHPSSITGSQRSADLLDIAHKRLFHRIVGHNPRRTDEVERLARRVASIIRDPSVGMKRVKYSLARRSVKQLGLR